VFVCHAHSSPVNNKKSKDKEGKDVTASVSASPVAVAYTSLTRQQDVLINCNFADAAKGNKHEITHKDTHTHTYTQAYTYKDKVWQSSS